MNAFESILAASASCKKTKYCILYGRINSNSLLSTSDAAEHLRNRQQALLLSLI